MSNKIKTTGATSLASAKRNTNFSIGVNGYDDYGPTSVTGFYNGITPPVSGYTIYKHKASGGPSINVASNDEECIFFLKEFGATGSTINDVLVWASGRTDVWVQTEDLTTLVVNTPNDDLVTIATYLRNYMSDFRNPNFFSYRLDGDGYYISDGAFDMYDNGNITSPWIIAGTDYSQNSSGYSPGTYPYAVNYTNSGSTTTIDTSFNYISLGYEQFNGVQSSTYLPLTVIGTRDNETYGDGLPVGFQASGNSGADGGGTLSNGYIYSGATLSGFTVYAYYRETYNAGDPSHCDLYILLGHTNWDSNFGTVYAYAQPVNAGGNGAYLYTSGAGVKNILAIKTLLSKQNGVLVTLAECQTVVDNFVIRIKEALSF